MFSMLRRKRGGSFLVYGLVVMTFVSILLTSIAMFVSSYVKISLQTSSRDESFHVAEAGVSWYRWYLAHMTDGRTAQQIQSFWAGTTPLGKDSPYEAEYRDESGPVGRYRVTVTPPALGSTIVTATVTGWTYKYPAGTRTIRVRFRRPSWSEYSALANDNMRFGEGTEVYGKIHSNLGIRFDGWAHNIVSSSLSSYADPDHTGGNEFGVHTHVNTPPASGSTNSFRSAEAPPSAIPSRPDVFIAGRAFPVPTVDFNGVLADLNLMKTNAQSSSNYFDATGVGRQIFLNSNGTYDVYVVNAFDATTNGITSYLGTKNSNGTGASCTTATVQSGPPVQCKDKTSNPTCYCNPKNYKIPDNGVIFVENNIWLDAKPSGTSFQKLDKSYQGSTLMNGEMKTTVVGANVSGGSNSSVFLGGSPLTYARSDGSVILGIIGQQDIEAMKNSQDHLEIDGALLAQSGRVGRANYGTSDIKNTITVNGAIATNQRYGFAWTNSSTGQSWGYTYRNLIFDNNLLYYPPPFFPTGTQYLMDLWEEL